MYSYLQLGPSEAKLAHANFGSIIQKHTSTFHTLSFINTKLVPLETAVKTKDIDQVETNEQLSSQQGIIKAPKNFEYSKQLDKFKI